jgi:hypothetical protein
MNANYYTRIDVVSPDERQFQPEILVEADMGHIDENMVSRKILQQVIARAFRKSVPVKPVGEKDQAQVEAQDQAQVDFQILSACAQGPMSSAGIVAKR